MFKVYVFTAVLILANSVLAQSDEAKLIEQKKTWQETGYGFPELFSEPDFQTSECIKSEKMYLACLNTLNGMLISLEKNPKVILLSSSSSLSVQPLDQDLKSKKTEELKALENSWKAQYKEAYVLSLFEPLDSLFSEVHKIMEDSLPASDQAYYAGLSFDRFLKLAFDPHTGFAPKVSQGPKANNYVGMGAYVNKFELEGSDLKGAMAISPMKGSPAEAAGLKKGDLIVAVDGVSILDTELTDATKLIKGIEGTTVSLLVHRICTSEKETVVVTRGAISNLADWTKDSKFVSLEKDADPIDVICNDQKKGPKKGEPQALYVPMASFIHMSRKPMDLCREFVNELQRRDLENTDSLGMIIDLRGNGGGYLVDVACMLDTLVNDAKGTIIGQQAVDRGELVSSANIQSSYDFDHIFQGAPVTPYRNTAVHYNKKIVVLTNGRSASASEIFSGSIQDLKRGWIVGDRTFGKGSVQTPRTHLVREDLRSVGDKPLQIKRTTAIYTLNSGRSPQNYGIIPDFRFDEIGESIVDKEDAQAGEAMMQNTISFSNNQSVQNRPKLVNQILDCTQNNSSISENLKTQLKNDDRYKIPFVSSFQLSLAKDVMNCAPERQDFLN